MKRTYPPDERSRFDGQLRHYHRTSSKSDSSWDEWIDGKPAGSRSRRNWGKILAVTAAFLALAGIATGLIIELGLR